jgi:hypothetical protein
VAAEKSTTMKSRTVSYPIDPDALKSVWNINGSNSITKHGNTVGMPLGPITSIGSSTSGTYFGNTGPYGATPTWTNGTTGVGQAPVTVNASGKIDLQGESADITINGTSLLATLAALQERLNWMQPATELEAEWDQLRELGDRYRELEKQCREKAQMWTKLKTLPKTNQT